MNIGICDDLKNDRNSLRELLLAYSSNFNIFEYESGEELLSALGRGESFDLLFLDVFMGGINGIETARQIRETNKKLPIIFLTSSPDFSLSAFSVRAVGYLLKPVNNNELCAYLDDLGEKPEISDTWLLSSTQGTLPLSVGKILFCEQRGHYVEIHMEDGTTYYARMTFAKLQAQLSFYPNIYPCGSSYLVNLPAIHTLNRQDLLLIDGTTLPIPRRSFNALRDAYLAFYKGEL